MSNELSETDIQLYHERNFEIDETFYNKKE